MNPLADACFAGVDLLSSAYQTNYRGPVRVSVKTGNQELRLRMGKIRSPLLLKHELRGLFAVPRPLGFVEKRYVLDRGATGISQTFVAKMVHVLDEQLDLTQSLTLLEPSASFRFAPDVVPRQRFAQYGNEWAVSG